MIYYMSNLNNVYAVCPGLMSDGRSQNTDYKSHNLLLKQMKGDIDNSYDFKVKLQGSGIRDMAENIRFNMCSTVPAGNINLNREINLNIEKSGSYLDAFGPLSSNTFFGKSAPVITPRSELTLPATKLPLYSPYKISQTAPMIAAPMIAAPMIAAPMIAASMIQQPVPIIATPVQQPTPVLQPITIEQPVEQPITIEQPVLQPITIEQPVEQPVEQPQILSELFNNMFGIFKRK